MLASVEVYKKIAPKLGEQEASDLILFIEDAVRNTAVTRADLERATHELESNFNDKLISLEKSLRKEIAEVRSELKADLADVRKEIADVRKEIADVRKEIADVKKEVAELRGLMLKYILPMSSLIGGIVGTVISVLVK